MSYTLRHDVPVKEGENAVELEDGTIVAVSCTREPINGVIQFAARARAVDAEGGSIFDRSGEPIVRELQHGDRTADRADAVARDCLLAVLGEPPQIVAWSSELLLDVSIRQAIALANINSGAVDAASIL